MSTKNNTRYSARDLVLVFLFIALFLSILVWLFPTKEFLKDLDFGGNNSQVEENQGNDNNQFLGLNSMLYNQNLTQMKEAAILYFTTPRLPQNIGDTKKLTLGEMLDMHLVTNIVDMSGNTCDRDASYVLLTKVEDEYTLKVNLKCGDTEEYIIVYIGCYSYCEGPVCQSRTKEVVSSSPAVKRVSKSAYECEYRLGGRWTKWSNWSAWQKEKPKASSSLQVEKKVIVKGGKTETIAAGQKKEYSCASGYVLDGKKCIKTQNAVRTATKTTTTTCPTGYIIKDGQCSKTVKYTRTATKTTTYTCPSGYSYKNGTCKQTIKYTRNASKTTTKSCPSGYVISGSSCIRQVKKTQGATKTTISGGTVRETFTSPQGGSNFTLVKTYTGKDCSDGCRVITYYVYDIKKPDTVKYSCPSSGWSLSGTTCTKIETSTKELSVTTSYSCPAGYTKDGSKCYRYETTTKSPSVNTAYSCPAGYTKDGSKCYRTETTTTTANKTVKYSCPSGYSLDGTKCYKTTSETATPTKTTTYTCPTGYTKEGTKCYRKIVTTVTATEKIKYTCKSGYELSGTKCIKYIGGTKVTYYRYRTRKYINGDIKWSTCKVDTKLTKKGYVLTGNKRLKYSK